MMKPTIKPSLLMLWIARVAAIYGLAQSLFYLGCYTLWSDGWFYAPKALTSTLPHSFHLYLVETTILSALIGATLIASLLLLHLKTARICLGLIAAYSFLRTLYFALFLGFNLMLSHSHFGKAILLVALSSISLMIYTLYFLIALRPPTRSDSSSDDSLRCGMLTHSA